MRKNFTKFLLIELVSGLSMKVDYNRKPVMRPNFFSIVVRSDKNPLSAPFVEVNKNAD